MEQAIIVIPQVEAVGFVGIVLRLHVGEVMPIIYLSLPIKRPVHIHPYTYPIPRPIIKNIFKNIIKNIIMFEI
jgi:hypothetical protein